MKNETNVAVIQGLYAAINERDFDYLTALSDAKSEWFDIPFNTITTGEASAIASWERWLTIFPDATCEIKNLIAADNYVIVQGIDRGTHQGVFTFNKEQIEPSGLSIEVGFCDIFYLNEGKIVKANSNFDVCSLLRQLAA